MEDLLLIDNLLTTEEKLIRQSVREFVDAEIIPHMMDAYEKAYFPEDLLPQLVSMGLFGLNFSAVGYGLVCQELERADSAIRSFVSVQNSLCMFPIKAFGSQEQQDRYLPDMEKGEIIGCFGLTEPSSGSDPASMQTRAKKVDGGWRLNGNKMWITNAPIAKLAIIWAKTEQGVRGFLVDTKSKGFKSAELKHKLSLRVSITGEIAMEDVFVPEDHLLPGTEKGLSCALKCLTQARYGIAWGAMGAAEYCLDQALEYCKDRQQFSRPLAANQLVQKDLADMATEIYKAKLLNLHIGRLKEQQQADPVMISLAKGNACREALKITRKARNLLGGNGISLEFHVIRHMTNLETVFTYEGTDNVHTLMLGRYLTGINAF